jgi:hypothetical protein
MGKNTLPGIGAGVVGAVGLGQAIYGGIKANRLGREIDQLRSQRPTYKGGVAESTTAATELYRQRAGRSKMPGQTELEQRLSSNVARQSTQMRDVARSSADVIRGTGALQNVYQRRLQDIAIQSAKEKAMRESEYGQALYRQGAVEQQERQKEFYWNKALPYQQEMRGLQQQRQSAYNALTGGIGMIGGAGMSFASGSGE